MRGLHFLQPAGFAPVQAAQPCFGGEPSMPCFQPLTEDVFTPSSSSSQSASAAVSPQFGGDTLSLSSKKPKKTAPGAESGVTDEDMNDLPENTSGEPSDTTDLDKGLYGETVSSSSSSSDAPDADFSDSDAS